MHIVRHLNLSVDFYLSLLMEIVDKRARDLKGRRIKKILRYNSYL